METKLKNAKYDLPPNLQQHYVKYSTLWMKFVRPKHICLLGRDALCVAAGCHLLVRHLATGVENIINLNEDAGGGNGASCIAGHKTHPFLAYAEKRESPRVFLLTYPELKYADPLTCGFYDIVKLTFSDGELLYGISGYPECSLIVWKWRTSEVMATMPTDMLFNRNVLLHASYTSQPMYLTQVVKNTSEMKIWEIGCCGKKCILLSENVTFDYHDPRLKIVDLLWTNDGSCYTIDSTGNVFKHDFETNIMKKIIAAKSGNDGAAAFCWYNNGLMVQSGDRQMRHYLKENNWALNCTWEQDQNFMNMYSTPTRDYLIVLTKHHNILYHDEKNHTYPYLRGDEALISHFGLVPPQLEYIVTLGKHINLSLWEAATGILVHSITLETPAMCLRCNDQYPYVAVGFQDGTLKLFSCHKRALEPLAQFQLTRIPLQKVKFFEFSRVLVAVNMDVGQIFVLEGAPGGKFKVISAITRQSQIVDFLAVGARSCLRLFVIPVTSDKFLAGNKIVRYCIVKKLEATVKTYELENPDRLYMALYATRNQPQRDRLMYAMPFGNKSLHELEVKRGDTHARIVNRFKSNHLMKMIFYVFGVSYVLSYAYDGIVIIREVNFDIKYVVMPHHRYDGGIERALFDSFNKRLYTLGRDGLLLCCQVPGPLPTAKQQAMLYAKAEELSDMFKQPTGGFMPRGIYQGLSWLEFKEMLLIDGERLKYEKQRQQIVDQFRIIQAQAHILLDHNLDGPEKERLELQDFNLNLQHKDDLVRASREQCERLKYYLEKLIQDHDRIALIIKKYFWDPMEKQTKNLWAIFGNFDVQNFAVLPFDAEESKMFEKIDVYRQIEAICAREDSFKPWTFLSEKDKSNLLITPPKLSDEKSSNVLIQYDDDDISEKSTEECADEHETFVAYFGSTVPLYIDLPDPQYNQNEIQSLIQHYWTYATSRHQQQKLRDHFNKEFEVLVQAKSREMSNIIERNARLRYIISELNYFSDEKLSISLFDPTWRQDENPILITKVENNEVGILPYITPSEQAFLEAKAAEEERIRLLLLADDFKERALMKMMNGVLEIRWEDELRREVPKPKCMLDKKPEDFNEEDLRLIKEYEEACRFLESERVRYKTILQTEYTKVGNALREGVKKFNNKLEELLVKKIQIESALLNETLRMHRLRMHAMQREDKDKAEIAIEKEIKENDLNSEELGKLIASLNVYDDELKTYLETLIAKERIVDKNFKRENQDYSQPQVELLTKLYKKRPKSNLKLITSPCTLLEMAKVIGTKATSLLLFGDALDYPRAVDLLDKYIGIPIIIDENMYHNMIRIRRMKIEMELKIKSCQMEIAEAENTQQMYISHLNKSKEHGQNLLTKLENIRAEKVKAILNIELQLVIKSAFVEIPRTGSQKDFEDAILVNRKEVENINTIILETGAKKIHAMRNALQFRKEIMIKEWHHKRKKMEISDLEHRLVEINSIKLTKEIQQFLKTRSRGDTEKIVSFEHELQSLKGRYHQQIVLRKQDVFQLNAKLEVLRQEHERLNKEIMKVNIDVNEANVKVDDDLSEKEKKLTNIRIQANLKRSRLVSQIQANHNEILMLQAELELCRLRTVPILDYKINV